MNIFKLLTIFVLTIIFFCLIKTFKINFIKRVLRNKEDIFFNKKNLNKWMDLTKKERYNLTKKDSLSYLKKRKGLLEEIRKEYKRIPKSQSKKK